MSPWNSFSRILQVWWRPSLISSLPFSSLFFLLLLNFTLLLSRPGTFWLDRTVRVRRGFRLLTLHLRHVAENLNAFRSNLLQESQLYILRGERMPTLYSSSPVTFWREFRAEVSKWVLKLVLFDYHVFITYYWSLAPVAAPCVPFPMSLLRRSFFLR